MKVYVVFYLIDEDMTSCIGVYESFEKAQEDLKEYALPIYKSWVTWNEDYGFDAFIEEHFWIDEMEMNKIR